MSTFELGIDRLLSDAGLRAGLKGRRTAFLGNPSSVTRDLVHGLDALVGCGDVRVCCAFGPQHGMRGDKQDNMIESDDYLDPTHRIPVFSLYGNVRRPTPEMLDAFDVLLVDLQDLGCRVYTYLTTLLYLLEDCARTGKSVWVLDRPNPAGRRIEGATLAAGQESFVGAAEVPMRHGLTLGEAARWYVARKGLDVDLTLVEMNGYDPEAGPGFGWPEDALCWVSPSPNASSLNMARCYSGTVLLEGTSISEGRGTALPLELLGAPDLDIDGIVRFMEDHAPDWIRGCRIRPCVFQPMHQKHAGQACNGIQIHAVAPFYDPERFSPFRLVAIFLKAVRRLHPDLELWRKPPYEYEARRLPVDVINGGPSLREWVDAVEPKVGELEAALARDESAWEERRREFLLY